MMEPLALSFRLPATCRFPVKPREPLCPPWLQPLTSPSKHPASRRIKAKFNSRYFERVHSIKWSDITLAADPSDHGNDKHVDWLSAFELRFQPDLPGGARYFLPVLTADGKLDCSPK